MKYCVAHIAILLMLASADALPQYTAAVKNFKGSPVIVKPLKSGQPGFTIQNRSNRSIERWRLGCIGKSGNKEIVTFAFIPRDIPLSTKSPENRTTFNSWTHAQVACANRNSRIAVIEVLFADGKTWGAPLSFDTLLVSGKGGFIIP